MDYEGRCVHRSYNSYLSQRRHRLFGGKRGILQHRQGILGRFSAKATTLDRVALCQPDRSDWISGPSIKYKTGKANYLPSCSDCHQPWQCSHPALSLSLSQSLITTDFRLVHGHTPKSPTNLFRGHFGSHCRDHHSCAVIVYSTAVRRGDMKGRSLGDRKTKRDETVGSQTATTVTHVSRDGIKDDGLGPKYRQGADETRMWKSGWRSLKTFVFSRSTPRLWPTERQQSKRRIVPNEGGKTSQPATEQKTHERTCTETHLSVEIHTSKQTTRNQPKKTEKFAEGTKTRKQQRNEATSEKPRGEADVLGRDTRKGATQEEYTILL